MIPLWLAVLASADPTAVRAPVDGDAVLSLGAPVVSAAVALSGDERHDARLGLGVRWPAGAVELAVGTTRYLPGDGPWRLGYGGAIGLFTAPGSRIGHTLTPWARVERRGKVRGGAQIAAPLTLGFAPASARLPIVVEPFLGGRIGRVDLSAQGGLGWAWPGRGAGALAAQGSLHLGVTRERRP
jgi:hypothetical protein